MLPNFNKQSSNSINLPTLVQRLSSSVQITLESTYLACPKINMNSNQNSFPKSQKATQAKDSRCPTLSRDIANKSNLHATKLINSGFNRLNYYFGNWEFSFKQSSKYGDQILTTILMTSRPESICMPKYPPSTNKYHSKT